MVLVVGATGLVGMEVCRSLAGRGEQVRALVRTTSSQDKVDGLRAAGVELVSGDLKDAASLERACAGVHAIISTASSTLTRQAGDSIESVDSQGQINLVAAAKRAGIDRFIFVSYRHQRGFPSPLSDAKNAVEKAIADMNYTVIQASWFMEVWLSPALGFDYITGNVRILGTGEAPVSFVSYRDVAEMCVVALRHPAAQRKVIEFGGPEAIAPLEVVRRFESITGKKLNVTHIPEQALREQYESASDPMQKSFAALSLGCVNGDPMDMKPVMDTFDAHPSSLDDYIRQLASSAATA